MSPEDNFRIFQMSHCFQFTSEASETSTTKALASYLTLTNKTIQTIETIWDRFFDKCTLRLRTLIANRGWKALSPSMSWWMIWMWPVFSQRCAYPCIFVSWLAMVTKNCEWWEWMGKPTVWRWDSLDGVRWEGLGGARVVEVRIFLECCLQSLKAFLHS